MRQFSNVQNSISLIGTLIVLVFTFWARLDLMPLLRFFNYLTIISLAGTIFILPDFIFHYFSKYKRWYQTSEFYTIALILFLTLTGLIAGRYAIYFGYLIVPIGIGLILWELFQYLRLNKIPDLLIGVLFMSFIMLLFYTYSFLSPIYPETVILGENFPDTLFHSSISNLFSSGYWATTGIDSTPYLSYHWASHAIFAGLSKILGINSLIFYNITYPAIFVPLFFKVLFSFISKLFVLRGRSSSINLIFTMTIVILIFSSEFMDYRIFEGESFNMSLVFTFLYGSILLTFSYNYSRINIAFYAYTIFILTLISFLKISTGLIVICSMVYLAIRITPNFLNVIKVSIGGILIILFIYLFAIPNEFMKFDISVMGHNANLWRWSNGFITYLSGAFIAVIVLLKSNKLSNWKDWKIFIRERRYLDIETLLIFSLVGFAAAVYVSAHSVVASYFGSTQIFISIAFLVIFLQMFFDSFLAAKTLKFVFLVAIIALSIISRPDFLNSGVKVNHFKKDLTNLTQNQKLIEEYQVELFKLNYLDKKEKCIYIPFSEKWYYSAQQTEVFSAFITPAISGIPLIGGISDSTYMSNGNFSNYYSLNAYKKQARKVVNSILDATRVAKSEGFKELIQYREVNGMIVKEVFALENEP